MAAALIPNLVSKRTFGDLTFQFVDAVEGQEDLASVGVDEDKAADGAAVVYHFDAPGKIDRSGAAPKEGGLEDKEIGGGGVEGGVGRRRWAGWRVGSGKGSGPGRSGGDGGGCIDIIYRHADAVGSRQPAPGVEMGTQDTAEDGDTGAGGPPYSW